MENSSPEFNYTSSSLSQQSSVKQVDLPDELIPGSQYHKPTQTIANEDIPQIRQIDKLLIYCAANESQTSKGSISRPETKTTLQNNRANALQGLPISSNKQLGKKPQVKLSYSTKPLGQEVVPQPMVWIERCPYSRQVIDYEQRLVFVPVHRIQRGEYQIEHIIEFARRQVPQIRLQVQPRQVIDYKLQYVPVQSKILHLPQRCVSPPPNLLSTINEQPQFQTTKSKISSEFKPKFVTTPTYDYNLRVQQMKLLQAKMQMLKHKQGQLRPIS